MSEIKKGDWVEIRSINGHVSIDEVSEIDFNFECIRTKGNRTVTPDKHDVHKVNVLPLTLSALPFEVMVTREKSLEFRKPGKNDGKWIKDRLYNKDGTKRHWDYVRFTHGYGRDKPYFVARYVGFHVSDKAQVFSYSNGLKVEVAPGDYILHLGEIAERGNLRNEKIY